MKAKREPTEVRVETVEAATKLMGCRCIIITIILIIRIIMIINIITNIIFSFRCFLPVYRKDKYMVSCLQLMASVRRLQNSPPKQRPLNSAQTKHGNGICDIGTITRLLSPPLLKVNNF